MINRQRQIPCFLSGSYELICASAFQSASKSRQQLYHLIYSMNEISVLDCHACIITDIKKELNLSRTLFMLYQVVLF